MNEPQETNATIVDEDHPSIGDSVTPDPDEQLQLWVEQRQAEETQERIGRRQLGSVARQCLMYARSFKWCIIAFLVPIGIVYVPSLLVPSDGTKSEAKVIVTDWLEAQRRGEDGFRYWHDKGFIKPSRLFSVRSWEIVNQQATSFSAEFTVLIDSNTKIGTQITKTWKVELFEYDDELKITDVKDLSDS